MYNQGVQSSKVELRSKRKVQDMDKIKYFILQDENDKYIVYAMDLEMQNE